MEGPEIWPRDSLSYRRTVAIVACFTIVQCGSLAVKALRDGGIQGVGFPTSHHQSAGARNYHRSTRWNRTKQATLAQGSIAVLCGVATLTAAFLSSLAERPVNIYLCFLAAASRWVDASYSWDRFLLVHPDLQLTRRQVLQVRAFIFVGLCLPYLTPPLYMVMATYAVDLKRRHSWVYRSVLAAFTLLDLFMVPATVYWDCSLGCRFINKIRQLNAALQSGEDGGQHEREPSSLSHTQVLLSLSRNTLAYILISVLANSALVLAYCKVIPGVALVSLLFHLSFTWTTYYLLGAKASTVTFAFLSNCLSYLRVGGRNRRRQRRAPGAGTHQENSNSRFWPPSSTGVVATAGMTSSPGMFRLSTQTATAPSDTASRPRHCGEGDSALVPDEEPSERSPAGPFHNISLAPPPPNPSFPLSSPPPKSSGRAAGAGASPHSLSPSWNLRGHSPSPPAGQQQQAGSPISRPPLRFFAKYALGRGADTRGLFRLSEEGSSDATSAGSSSNNNSGDSSQGNDVSSRLTGSSSAARMPSSAHSEGGGKTQRGEKGVGRLWWDRKRNAIRSTSSTSTAPGRRTILGFESAFSSPSADSSSSASISSGKGGGKASGILSPASV